MALARAVLSILLALVLSAGVLWVHRLAGEPLGVPGVASAQPFAPGLAPDDAGPAGGRALGPLESNESCAPCHAEIHAEWQEDQHALAWFNEPFLAPDPKLVECNNCHAPLPVLETGVEKLPVIRTDRFEEGVGCIECHRHGNRVEGPRPARAAPCNPALNPQFSDSSICASCHAPHGSLDEWKESAWAHKGYTCQACHMPLVDAPAVTGGPPVRRRSHRMRSQRDPEVLQSAVTLSASIVREGVVEVQVANTGAGHSVPGEISNRELFLLTRVLAGDGSAAAEHRESFKAPDRKLRASIPSTQLRAGETRRFEYALGLPHGKVEVLLGYKLLLFVPDDRSTLVWERHLEF